MGHPVQRAQPDDLPRCIDPQRVHEDPPSGILDMAIEIDHAGIGGPTRGVLGLLPKCCTKTTRPDTDQRLIHGLREAEQEGERQGLQQHHAKSRGAKGLGPTIGQIRSSHDRAILRDRPTARTQSAQRAQIRGLSIKLPARGATET